MHFVVNTHWSPDLSGFVELTFLDNKGEGDGKTM